MVKQLKNRYNDPTLNKRFVVGIDRSKMKLYDLEDSAQKGDAKWNKFLVDYKEASSSFTLNKPVWSKIRTDTFKVSREMHPALKIIIGTDSKVRLGIIEWAVLEELIQFWEENNGK